MYPETDVKVLHMTKAMIDKIEIPELLDDRVLKLEKEYKLPTILAKEVVAQNFNFMKIVQQFAKIQPIFIAKAFVEFPKEVKARYQQEVTHDMISEALELYSKRKITKDAVFEYIVKKSQGKKVDVKSFVGASDDDIKKVVNKVISENKDVHVKGLMGLVMKELRGRADGKKVMEYLTKVVKSSEV